MIGSMHRNRRNLDFISRKPFKKFKCIKCKKWIETMSIDIEFKICPKCDMQKEKEANG